MIQHKLMHIVSLLLCAEVLQCSTYVVLPVVPVQFMNYFGCSINNLHMGESADGFKVIMSCMRCREQDLDSNVLSLSVTPSSAPRYSPHT